jgi:hypothetical protein
LVSRSTNGCAEGIDLRGKNSSANAMKVVDEDCEPKPQKNTAPKNIVLTGDGHFGYDHSFTGNRAKEVLLSRQKQINGEIL